MSLCVHPWRSGRSVHFALRAAICFLMIAIATPAMPQAKSSQPGNENVAPSGDQIWQSLMAGNERFIKGKPSAWDAVSRRQLLENTQHPLIAVLSCSDSRVPPEVIFDQELGDLFVVRGAGNSSDPITVGSLEYAVEHLGTVMIVVLGHQSCGAVKAACSGEAMPTQNLEAVVEPIAKSCRVAKQRHGSEDLVDFAVKDHVHETATDLLARSEVLKRAHDEGKLSVVEAYYSLHSGVVTRLR